MPTVGTTEANASLAGAYERTLVGYAPAPVPLRESPLIVLIEGPDSPGSAEGSDQLERRNPRSRRQPINRGRDLSRSFFEEGDRQQQAGWEASPLAEAPDATVRALHFDSFDQVPRRRAAGVVVTVVALGFVAGLAAWGLSGPSGLDKPPLGDTGPTHQDPVLSLAVSAPPAVRAAITVTPSGAEATLASMNEPAANEPAAISALPEAAPLAASIAPPPSGSSPSAVTSTAPGPSEVQVKVQAKAKAQTASSRPAVARPTVARHVQSTAGRTTPRPRRSPPATPLSGPNPKRLLPARPAVTTVSTIGEGAGPDEDEALPPTTLADAPNATTGFAEPGDIVPEAPARGAGSVPDTTSSILDPPAAVAPVQEAGAIINAAEIDPSVPVR